MSIYDPDLKASDFINAPNTTIGDFLNDLHLTPNGLLKASYMEDMIVLIARLEIF